MDSTKKRKKKKKDKKRRKKPQNNPFYIYQKILHSLTARNSKHFRNNRRGHTIFGLIYRNKAA